jgi:uncharacterized protein
MRSEAEVAAMSCPVCRVPLSMSDRQGIEIDYCPQCRGVWLDRGELDKIIERSASEAAAVAPVPTQAAPAPPPQPQPQAGYGAPLPYTVPGTHYDPRYNYHGKRKKSWMSSLFG